MLRRVARAFRSVLLLLGLVLLAWLPLSFLYSASVRVVGKNGSIVYTGGGTVWAWWTDSPTAPGADIQFAFRRHPYELDREVLTPVFQHPVGQYYVSLPLLLLAFLCLAWPVISFLFARRRLRMRGFAVEPRSPPAAAGADLRGPEGGQKG